MSLTRVSDSNSNVARDLLAGMSVFLVALPLCLGIALASGAPLVSGLIAGILGGIVVGSMSGSQTSVSGPAAGLAAIVVAEIESLGSFDVFLASMLIAGILQIILGCLRAGAIASFFPTSVIQGLLAAIGIVLILKQIPHVLGHDPSPEGEMSFFQPDQRNTFTELLDLAYDFEWGATIIGLTSVAMLIGFSKSSLLRRLPIPSPLIVTLWGVAAAAIFQRIGEPLAMGPKHYVQVPVVENWGQCLGLLQFPNWQALSSASVYVAGLTIAMVATLETLLNLQAVDKLDPRLRTSPPNRELLAQGVGNTIAGLIGGIPITSVIVRSSVNVNAGGRTKLAAIFHGLLLLGTILLIPNWLNSIPLASLAAILLVTGFKLANPMLAKQMWAGGKYQFAPFILTVLAIVFTDLLVGVILGIVMSLGFILVSNIRRPLRKVVEKHIGGDVLRIELANQVSFLNRVALQKAFASVPAAGHILLDASHTDYIDPDVLGLIREFKNKIAPSRQIEVSLLGFREKYQLQDQTCYVDYTTRDLQEAMTPRQVLDFLNEGHARFRSGRQLTRDYQRQVSATAAGQHPLAVVLGCIDSRTPTELIFDVGVGDVFTVRIAGNVTSERVLGSIEYACAVAGAKLIVVMGHTRCGAVTAAVENAATKADQRNIGGCEHLQGIVSDVQLVVRSHEAESFAALDANAKKTFVDEVARRNVERIVGDLPRQSGTVARLIASGAIAIVGAVYDVADGRLEFISPLPQ